MRYIILDLESHAIPDAADYLTEPVDAPSNYKSEEAILKYVSMAKKSQLEKAALDIDLARIVCLGMLNTDAQKPSPTVFVAKNEGQEQSVLGRLFDDFYACPMQDWPIAITFNGLFFDWPLLLRRALYLGVKPPKLQLDRYKHPHVVDLMAILNYDGRLKSHSLSFYCSRFGIPVNDENTGKDIAALIAADNWAAVEAHCASDVQATYALAKRMGVIA